MEIIRKSEPQATGARGASIVAATGCLATAAFETALALGAPFGRAAWGGQQTNLDTGLRVASGVAAALWVVAAAIVLKRGGVDLPWPSDRLARRGIWVLVALLGVGTLMNIASRSELERGIWAPVGLVMTALCLIVARRASRVDRERAGPS